MIGRPPAEMTTEERLDELAAILAAGLGRLRRKNQADNSGERRRISSTSTAHRSGHDNGETRPSRGKPRKTR